MNLDHARAISDAIVSHVSVYETQALPEVRELPDTYGRLLWEQAVEDWRKSSMKLSEKEINAAIADKSYGPQEIEPWHLPHQRNRPNDSTPVPTGYADIPTSGSECPPDAPWHVTDWIAAVLLIITLAVLIAAGDHI